jgi:hypothetical protein
MQRALRTHQEQWENQKVRLDDSSSCQKPLHKLVDAFIAALRLLKIDVDFVLQSSPKTWSDIGEFHENEKGSLLKVLRAGPD